MANVLYEVHDGVALITLNRPEQLNALNAVTLDEFGAAVDRADADDSVRVAVVTGQGTKAFVAGADIKEMQAFAPEDARRFSQRGHRAFAKMGASGTVFIAAVEGFCLGGGCELALACDWINAGEKAKFGQPEVSLGLIPGFGGTVRLSRRVGLAKALELCSSGAMIRADEALRIGLANTVFPAGSALDETLDQAKAIAAQGPLAVANVKRVIYAAADLPEERGNALEQQAFGLQFGTDDAGEGMTAFTKKRKANFRGV